MRWGRHGLSLFLSLVVLTPQPAQADAIVVPDAMRATTIAEVFVTEKSVRIELEIGPRDLVAFRNILPEDLYQKLKFPPKPHQERIRQFFAEDLTVRMDQGDPIPGKTKRSMLRPRVKRDEITGEPLPSTDNDPEIVVFAEVEYPLTGKPKTLSLSPPGRRGQGLAQASIGFVAYHAGLPVNDFRYLASEETMDLDWEDPWYTRFRNRNLRRQFDAPMSAFLYVDFFEVRKEILVRPRDLQHWVDLGLQGKKILRAGEQEELKKRVAAFLASNNPVTIDGQPVQGTLDRIHFIRRSLRQTGVIDPPEDLDLTSATLGVIYVYPIEGLPQEVSLRWELFSPRIQQVPAVATDEAGGLPATLTAEDPVLRWQNFLTNPSVPAMRAVPRPQGAPQLIVPAISATCTFLLVVLAVVGLHQVRSQGRFPWAVAGLGVVLLAGGVLGLPFAWVTLPNPLAQPASLSQEEARQVLGDLLHNIYRAFDRRDENLVYDRLAESVTGDLLAEVYLQTQRSMELERQGGARIKVDQVEVLDAIPEGRTEGGGFICRCRWNVSGSVGHWGHIHQRTNQYQANFTVEAPEGAWKITAIDLRDETRIDQRPR
jgi:hypothetical protein